MTQISSLYLITSAELSFASHPDHPSMPTPSVFDHPDAATAMRMAFEHPPPPPPPEDDLSLPDGLQDDYASLRAVYDIGVPAVPRDGTGPFRPPTDPRLARPAQPAATTLDAGPGVLPPTGIGAPAVPLPTMQADDGRDVGTPADMTRAEMTTIEKVAPRKLGTLVGKDVQTLVTDENRSFFDCGASVRKGCREGGGVTYMPAYDVFRLSGASMGSACEHSTPEALVAAGTCTYHDIVMAKTALNVSAAPEICMGLKFVLLCETLRFDAFCTTIQILNGGTNLEIVLGSEIRPQY